jgi:hypothetical protein
VPDWACESCTFVNEDSCKYCEMCGTAGHAARPRSGNSCDTGSGSDNDGDSLGDDPDRSYRSSEGGSESGMSGSGGGSDSDSDSDDGDCDPGMGSVWYGMSSRMGSCMGSLGRSHHHSFTPVNV